MPSTSKYVVSCKNMPFSVSKMKYFALFDTIFWGKSKISVQFFGVSEKFDLNNLT